MMWTSSHTHTTHTLGNISFSLSNASLGRLLLMLRCGHFCYFHCVPFLVVLTFPLSFALRYVIKFQMDENKKIKHEKVFSFFRLFSSGLFFGIFMYFYSGR
jgi:hypothetical protein